jgi:hypothetical protein
MTSTSVLKQISVYEHKHNGLTNKKPRKFMNNNITILLKRIINMILFLNSSNYTALAGFKMYNYDISCIDKHKI